MAQSPSVPKPPSEDYVDQLQHKNDEFISQLLRALDQEKQKNQRVEAEREEYLKTLYLKSNKINRIKNDQDVDLQIPVDGDLLSGSRVFQMNCAQCHDLDISSQASNKKGPTLGLICNKRVGSDQQYLTYSRGLLYSEFFWTPLNLYRFMENPLKLVKSTTCGLLKKPLLEESDRADLLYFLREFNKELTKYTMIKVIKMKGYGLYQTQLYANSVGQQRMEQKFKT